MSTSMRAAPLRWEVVGDVFGRDMIVAAFLLKDDATAYLQAEADADGPWRDATVRERVA